MRFANAALVALLQLSPLIVPSSAFTSTPKFSSSTIANHDAGVGKQPLFMTKFDLGLLEDDNIDADEENNSIVGKGKGGLAAGVLGVATVQLHATKVCDM